MTVWSALLIGGIIVFFILMVGLLPRLFLKNNYTLRETFDRGIKKYKLKDDGYGIVYEPDLKIRGYVEQYVLVHQDGKKELQCKVREKISYLDFDVIAFDCANQVAQVLHVQDMVGATGYTRTVELPKETSYISILLNQVDDVVLTKQASVKISPLNMLYFWACGLGLSVCVSFCIKWCFSNMFGRVFRESFMLSPAGNALTVLMALLWGCVGLSLLTVFLIWKNKRK